MLKSFSFRLNTVLSPVSIFLIAETAFSSPLTVGSKYPVVPNSDRERLVCYMQTADGRTLNLDALCRDQPSKQPEMAISALNYEGDRIVGRVVNQSAKTVRFPKVNYEVLRADGSVIERGSTYAEPSMLSPGQTAMFQNLVPDGTKNVRAISIEWED